MRNDRDWKSKVEEREDVERELMGETALFEVFIVGELYLFTELKALRHLLTHIGEASPGPNKKVERRGKRREEEAHLERSNDRIFIKIISLIALGEEMSARLACDREGADPDEKTTLTTIETLTLKGSIERCAEASAECGGNDNWHLQLEALVLTLGHAQAVH